MWKYSVALSEIVYDKLYIGKNIHDLDEEIKNNTWSISADSYDKVVLSMAALLHFFAAVVENRTQQISNAHITHGMYFYVWHDKQAFQLRFGLISDFHHRLPFAAQITKVELHNILQEFLSANSFLPFNELTIEDDPQGAFAENLISEPTLRVFEQHLP